MSQQKRAEHVEEKGTHNYYREHTKPTSTAHTYDTLTAIQTGMCLYACIRATRQAEVLMCKEVRDSETVNPRPLCTYCKASWVWRVT